MNPKLGQQYEHGGGRTTINLGFQYFEDNVLPYIPIETEIKMIFISDGQDNNLSTLQNRLKL